MKKSILITLLIGAITLLGACRNKTSETAETTTNKEASSATKAKTYLTYLSSTEDPLKYCAGQNMNSDGYKKTITNKITTNIVIDSMTQTEIAKATILAATSGMCKTAMEYNAIKIQNDTTYISPIDAWAGISIAMCSCRPEIEVNLLQLTGITKVVFE